MDNDDRSGDRMIEAREVARFLTAHPDWLATQAGLYERLSPPRRVHGEALADHMAAMIDVARQHTRTVLDAGRAALGVSERVKAAVLALIRSADLADWVGVELPRLMGLDSARLCVEGDEGVPGGVPGSVLGSVPGSVPGSVIVPGGTVGRLLGAREVRVRVGADPAEAPLLHGEAAGLAVHDALLRVPVMSGAPMLLALATRDGSILQGTGSEAALAFLAAALAARMERA